MLSTRFNKTANERKLMSKTQVAPEWLDYASASQYSGLGRTTLWQLVSAGEIKAARIGRAVRISRASLEDYMERQAGAVA